MDEMVSIEYLGYTITRFPASWHSLDARLEKAVTESDAWEAEANFQKHLSGCWERLARLAIDNLTGNDEMRTASLEEIGDAARRYAQKVKIAKDELRSYGVVI